MSQSLKEQAKTEGVTPDLVKRVRKRGVLECLIYMLAGAALLGAQSIWLSGAVSMVVGFLGGLAMLLAVGSAYAALRAHRWLAAQDVSDHGGSKTEHSNDARIDGSA